MLHLPTVKDDLGGYIDAGFPILYICTYEEAKADRYISLAAGRKKIPEWNGSGWPVDFKKKAPLLPGQPLETVLDFLKKVNELEKAFDGIGNGGGGGEVTTCLFEQDAPAQCLPLP